MNNRRDEEVKRKLTKGRVRKVKGGDVQQRKAA